MKLFLRVFFYEKNIRFDTNIETLELIKKEVQRLINQQLDKLKSNKKDKLFVEITTSEKISNLKVNGPLVKNKSVEYQICLPYEKVKESKNVSSLICNGFKIIFDELNLQYSGL